MTDVPTKNFAGPTAVSRADDMLSDRVYAENFEVVLGHDNQDLYDMLSSLGDGTTASERESLSTSEVSLDEEQTRECTLDVGVPICSQALVQFKTPLALKSLRNLQVPYPASVQLHFTCARDEKHTQQVFESKQTFSGRDIAVAVAARLEELNGEMQKIGV